ncbi:MAG: dTDP-4-dehydrorhamnose 3,5-epimerase [Planctomycetota bacterium]|nr:MAG: dTDP-4-dehydrorhamnose 3,5-epimerase [Planctomycetota bacterium]
MTGPFLDGPIEGVVVRPLRPHQDSRGWLAEVFRQDEMDGLTDPAMAYVSVTLPGVTRGPHEHREQADLFAFAGPGEFQIVLWDARPNSPTRNRRMVEYGGRHRPTLVYVPAGVVHAYRSLGPEEGWVWNFPDRLYRGRDRCETVDEIRHEDQSDSPFQMPEA